MAKIDEEVKLMQKFVDGETVKFRERPKGRFNSRPLKDVVTIVPNTDGKRKLYHLSIDGNIPRFTFKKRADRMGSGEDQEVPKIYTGDTLIGCLMGMWDVRTIVHGSAASGKEHVGEFIGQDDEHVMKVNKGGQFIYALDFDVALKPTPDILDEVKVTNEHWLVPYKGQEYYNSKIIGKIFMDYALLQNNHNMDRANYIQVLLFELSEGMPLTDGRFLKSGYYRMTYHQNYLYDTTGYRTEVVNTPVNINELVSKIHLDVISKSEYLGKKEAIVPNLLMKKKKLGLFSAW